MRVRSVIKEYKWRESVVRSYRSMARDCERKFREWLDETMAKLTDDQISRLLGTVPAAHARRAVARRRGR